MKKVYVVPRAEIVKLNVSGDINETEFGIHSKEGVETLSKKVNMDFDDEYEDHPTGW